MTEHQRSSEPSDARLAGRVRAFVRARFLRGATGYNEEQLAALAERAVEVLKQQDPELLRRVPINPARGNADILDRVREMLGSLAQEGLGEREDVELWRQRIQALDATRRQQVLEASLRQHVGAATGADLELLSLVSEIAHATPAEVRSHMTTSASTTMPNTPAPASFYKADTTNLPSTFQEAPFVQAVNDAITALGIAPDREPVLRNGIIGMLLLDGNIVPGSPSFGDQIRNRLWNYIQSTLVDANGQPVGADGKPVPPGVTPQTNKAVFEKVDGEIQRIRGAQGAFYQELATTARQIIDGQRGANVFDPILLSSAVQAALQNYGTGTDSRGTFELPPLTGGSTGGGIDEIIPDNVRGVAMLYAALQLEVAGLFKVVDRNVEIFMNGQLPVSNDLGGNALDAYYWDSVNRMSESARWMHYSRVLGAKGGEVSRDVQPNTAFDGLFMRFLASVSEFLRQQRLSNLLGNDRGLTLTAETVRSNGHDVGGNASLFGFGSTQFVARRLQRDIQSALNILKLPDIQQAWGVNNAWQVIERVSAQEFKVTPNVVKYRTMADSGKRILDIVAKNAPAWSSISNNPLFSDDTGDGDNGDISRADQQILFRHTEFWLAVNGIQDQQIVQNAQPVDSGYAPSIPSLDGVAGAGGGGGPDVAGQIQRMLQQGQTPSADQLRQMVGV